MITSEQKLAAHNAAMKRKVILKFIGVQTGIGDIPSRPLFNVVGGDYCIGSTITLETAERLGLEVEAAP